MKVMAREQRRGKSLTLHFSILHKDGNYDLPSEVFNIDDSVEVCFKFTSTKEIIYTSISLKKHASAHDSTIEVDVNSEYLNFSQQWTCRDLYWTDWQQMNTEPNKVCGYLDAYNLNVFYIDITVREKKACITEKIYQDSDLTDFILSTTDGSIPVHKIFLAAHSDVFKTMLSQEWKETAEGRVQIESVTLKTLQHLKQYMYLGTLPDGVDALLPLLRLAVCYLIDTLKSACISKLACMVTSEKLDDVVVFAVENKIPELTFAILQLTPDKIVQGAYQLKKKEQNTVTEEEKADKE